MYYINNKTCLELLILWESKINMKKSEFILNDLVSKIVQKKFESLKLPSLRELAGYYQVSVTTIQNILTPLRRLGIVYAKPKSGLYLYSKNIHKNMIFNTMTKYPVNDIKNEMIYLYKRPMENNEYTTFDLDLDQKQYVWEFARKRTYQFEVVEIEKTIFPYYLFPIMDKSIVEGSLQMFVHEQGHRISHYMTTYKSVLLTREESIILRVKKQPAMKILNYCIWEDGQIYGISETTALDYSVTYVSPFDTQILKQYKKGE